MEHLSTEYNVYLESGNLFCLCINEIGDIFHVIFNLTKKFHQNIFSKSKKALKKSKKMHIVASHF